jgi:diguanylate cyclase (GGDEF)-like protein
VVGCLQDVTETKVAERERDRLSQRVKVATQAAQVGIWDWNVASGAIDWDSTMFRLYGLDVAQGPARYERWAASLHDDDRAAAERDLALAASSGAPFDTEFRIVWSNGEVHNIRAMAVVVRAPDGLVERMIGTNWDVTAERTLADELQREKDLAADAAAHDTLTGLLNRRGLEMWIDSRPEQYATLLYLDVDGFKAVNDRGGHAAGDETLRVIARIIKDAVRGLDACARIGGDEFVVVLLGKIGPGVTRRIVARITAAVGALRPLGPSDDTRIGMSIGIGYVTGWASSDDALREADADLYRCKSERKRLAKIG